MDTDGYISRSLSAALPKVSTRFLVLVTGARQVGKTTMLRHSYPDLGYFSLDSVENREFLAQQKSSSWKDAPGSAIIDEIQKQPELMDKVKYAWDEGAIDQTIMTGSSQILLLRQVRETLAGRVRLLELFALSPAEISGTAVEETLFTSLCAGTLDIKNVQPLLMPSVADTLRSAEDYVYRWGGMPALLPLGETERKLWLADYRSTYLQRDVADLARLADLLPFAKFQRLVALRAATIVNYADLARDAGVGADTARRYFEYLRLSYQADFLMPWFSNNARRLIKSPKIIVMDMGIQRSLTGGWDMDSGELYENFVIAEMMKQIRTMKSQAELLFWRSSGGAEVDILLKTPRGVWGIELKSRNVVVSHDARHLRSVAAELGDSWLGGFVVYRGSTIEKMEGPSIYALPSWRLWGGL